ncbi:MAG TPA: sugar phosphate isomerase/epimerase family protein [Flavisolibacter sp.]|nr:sugar phosphate isomerase/epimerase family protein [Flavisolibacter sp.]
MLQRFLSLLGVLLLTLCTLQAQKLPVLGMVAGPEDDSLLYASGFRLIGTTVGNLIAPSFSSEEFDANLKKIRSLKCRLYLCNILFPASLKIAGPVVDEARVMEYLHAVLTRAKKAGVKNLVLGSGGARRLPEDYSREQAKTEFAVLAKKMAIAARQYGIIIILESLNSTETNFLNQLSEAADVVRRVNHQNFRLNADIYHMLKEGESPDEIRRAGDVIAYAEIAEKGQRTVPGVAGDDFRPYLKALKDIRYTGPLVIEGKAADKKIDWPKAYAFLTAQLKEVFRSNH